MHYSKEVAIVIPLYKENLEWYEEISLKRAFEVLNDYLFIFVCPNVVNVDNLTKRGLDYKVINFPDECFSSVESYNKLMMSEKFYSAFGGCKYILIYQLDAFVFSDRLKYFCDLQYDYMGAPWVYPNGRLTYKGKKNRLRVGNGGLSLRNVNSCIEVIMKYNDVVENWTNNEDVFFSYCEKLSNGTFKVAPLEIAMDFSFEWPVEVCYKRNKYRIPFGCHAWMKFGAVEYIKMFKDIGIDLSKYAELMGEGDKLQNKEIMRMRFISRLSKYKQLVNLLTDREAWHIIGLGKIGKLLVESILAADKKVIDIFDSNVDCEDCLYDNIPLKNLKGIYRDSDIYIIATVKYESEIMDFLKKLGWEYGTDFISIGREYAQRYKYIGYMKYLYGE